MNQPAENITLALSRRTFLGTFSAAALVALAGCETKSEPAVSTPVVERPTMPSMPEPALGEVESAGPAPLTPARPYKPPVDPRTVQQNPASGIIPRSVWALGGPDQRRIEPMGGVQWITFHHSGDPRPFYQSDFWETAKHLEGVREYHRSKSFNDIGYHFAIDRMGRVWQLRSLKYQGQHVRTSRNGTVWNRHNIGVVVLGNFDMQSPTLPQRQKIVQFAKVLRTEYGLSSLHVKTHRELVETNCPGRTMQPFMVNIRRSGLV